RPERGGAEPDDLHHRVEAEQEQGEDAGDLIAEEEAQTGQADQGAKDQLNPSPGGDVEDHHPVAAADHDDFVVGDRRDAPQRIEAAENDHQDPGKRNPAGYFPLTRGASASSSLHFLSLSRARSPVEREPAFDSTLGARCLSPAPPSATRGDQNRREAFSV